MEAGMHAMFTVRRRHGNQMDRTVRRAPYVQRWSWRSEASQQGSFSDQCQDAA